MTRAMKFWDSAAAWMLISAGICGFVVSIIDLVGLEDTIPILKDRHWLVLLVLGLLSGGIGLERLTRFKAVEETLDGIKK